MAVGDHKLGLRHIISATIFIRIFTAENSDVNPAGFLLRVVMKIISQVSVMIAMTVLASAETTPERLWTGMNGNNFSGVFHKLSPDGKNAEFLSSNGRLVSVAIENLIPKDREVILNPLKTNVSDVPVVADMNLFKPVASPSRQSTPLLSPKTFGCSTNQSLVDALLWWDQAMVLEIPKKGDLESKAQWLHNKLTRAVVVGGDNPTTEDAKKGVEDYFSDELEKVAACRVKIEQKNFSPTFLAGLLQGSNAVVLRMSMEYSSGKNYTVSSVLESMTQDGNFVIHVFGKRLKGRLKLMEAEKRGVNPPVFWEYVLDPTSELPDYYATNEAKFFMGKTTWNAVLLLKPYVYLTPGKIAPLPVE